MAWTRQTVFLSLAVLYALFVPTFHVYLGSQGAILVNGGLLAICLIYALAGRLRIWHLDRHQRMLVGILGCTMLFYGASICLSTLFMSDDVIFRDMFELHKPVLYLLAMAIPFTVFNEWRDLRPFRKLYIWIFFLVVAIGVAQYFRVLDLVGSLYTKTHNLNTRRVTVPFVNPYDYALFMSLFASIFGAKIIGGQYRFAPLFGMAVAMLVFTQSRAVVIGAATALGATIVFLGLMAIFMRGRVYVRMLVNAIVVYAITVVAVYLSYEFLLSKFRYLVGGIRAISQGRADRSLKMRFNQWDVVLEIATEHPMRALIGNGVSKASGLGLESIYSFYLYRYGVVTALLVFFVPLLGGLYSSARVFSRDPKQHIYALAIVTWLVTIAVASLSNNFTEQIRLSFIYYVIIAAVMRIDFLQRSENGFLSSARAREA